MAAEQMHGLLSPAHVALLVAVGFAAGFVNTAAGAGSLLSLRALMLLGVPANISNATNRLPVLAQSIAASLGFDKGGQLDRANVARAAIPASLGSIAGALAASYVPEKAMRYILIVALLGMAIVSAVGGRRSRPKNEASSAEKSDGDKPAPAAPDLRKPAAIAWLFVAGMYGGFLQAGVGLVLLFALTSVAGYDMVRANALKVIVVALFTIVSLGVFMLRGEVDYAAGLVMSIGAIPGARLAVKYAMGQGERLKRLVVACDVVACAVLLYREIAG
jgi:uncharacterized membrane protein YfcA